MAIQTVNPTTGKVEKVFQPSTSQEVDTALSHAVTAFLFWKRLSVAERAKYIQRVADLLEKERERCARLITTEMGRVYADALAEINKSIFICHFYIKNGEKFLQEQHVQTEASKSYVQYAPMGVVLGVMPWNFPFNQVFRALIPALIAGNVFVLKHASNVPQCAQAIADLFVKADFPEGVFTNLFLEGGNVSSVVADDRIAAVTLTGSEQAGAIVAKIAGEHLKKTVLELGGSDAFIVLEDADVAEAATAAAKGRFHNAGQACNSPKRIILSEKIAEYFTELFLRQIRGLKIGDPMDPATHVGPLARADLVDTMDAQVQSSLLQGARLLHGGKRIAGPGNFYAVTVVANVRKGMALFDEEVFGPVAVLTTVGSDDEAIAVANNTHLGLSASVWTKDIERAHHFVDNLHVGVVFVNQVVRSDPRLPFGGVKKSGYGRELGEHGIREFVNVKTVVIK